MIFVVCHFFFLCYYIWGQNNDLFRLHQVYTVIGLLLQWTSEYEVNLGVLIEL